MSVAKVYNGATWDTGIMKVWNGSAWVPYAKYYNGSAFVPLYPTDTNVVSIADFDVSDFAVAAGTAVAGIYVNSDGTIDRYKNNAPASGRVYNQDWINPTSAAPDDYEVRFTKTGGSGTLLGVTSGTWYALTSDRYASVQNNAFTGTYTVNLTIEIRKGTGSVLATGTHVLSAFWEP